MKTETRLTERIDPAAVLEKYDRLIKAVISEFCPRRWREHKTDIAQQARLHLWEHALAKYDSARGSLSTFVFSCTRQIVGREIAKLERQPHTQCINVYDLPTPAATDIEGVADDIIARPEAILTGRQRQVFDLLRSGADVQTIAEKLGIARSAVWNLTCQLKRRIGEVVG